MLPSRLAIAFAAVCFGLTALAAEPATKPTASRLEVPDAFSIDAPQATDEWMVKRPLDSEAGVYNCVPLGDAYRIVLTVVPQKVTRDVDKIATIKAYRQQLLDTLPTGSFTDVQIDEPELKPPLPSRVVLKGTMRRKNDGKERVLRVVVEFRERSYLLNVHGRDAQTADKGAAIMDTLKEIKLAK